MRYLLLFMLLVGLFVVGERSCHSNGLVFGFGKRGEGPTKSETRSITGFHAVELEVAGDVEVSVSDNYSVEVQAQENLLPILKTEVEDGVLKIYFSENVSHSDELKIRISGPAFDAFSIGGSGTIRTLTPLRAEKMELSIGGSGDVFIDRGEFGTLNISISGSGGVELGGTAGRMESSIDGSGDVKAKNFLANELEVSISGSGTVTCDVKDRLKASISGSGDVFYSGQPVVDASVSGSGSVQKVSEM